MYFRKKHLSALTNLTVGFLDKSSVASLGVGIFQDSNLGIVIGTVCIVAAAVLTFLKEDLYD